MSVQIVLLRGINVGSKRRIAMADLRRLIEDLGHEEVRTYLQSGNVLLASGAEPDKLGAELQQQISGRFGIAVPVIVRTREELAHVVARNPLGDVADEPKRYQVSFLSAKPEAAVVRAISCLEVAPERVIFSGREIYAWHPDGVHQSKLARLLSDERLGVTATARNWRTVTQLLAMAKTDSPRGSRVSTAEHRE